MPNSHQGEDDARGLRFAVVVSRYNDFITKPLLDGCVATLTAKGATDSEIDVYWVPGAFELPLVAKKLAESGKFDAVICLGAIIRSDTPHFDYVAGESAKGIARVGLDSGVPVIFGVITADTVDQAVQRAGVKAGNRGWDAALNAVEMASLMAALG